MESLRLIEPLDVLLDHPSLSDLLINGFENVFADFGAGLQRIDSPFSSDEAVRTWVFQCMHDIGLGWNARYPFIDFVWKGDFRIHAVLPPICQGMIHLSIRKHRVRRSSHNPWDQDPAIGRLNTIVQRRENLLIAGATGSGKTTLMEYLLNRVAPDQRILTIEDSRELAPNHPHHVALCVRKESPDGVGEIQAEHLLREALRMRPDRIVLGECRGPEVLQLLQALNTGHRGSMGTLHANSCREALRRLEGLCLWALGGGSTSLRWVRELITGSIQWLVQIEKSEGVRSISQICKVEGLEGDVILLRPLVQ